jgi:4-diphosphocytidyl-2-C-methyl-D-erythritol kinase
VTAPPELVEIAPAKINLALHVRGRRPDGRHDLETIFAFCTDGDRLSGSFAEGSEGMSLSVFGPFGGDVPSEGNLVSSAWGALRGRTRKGGDTFMRLEKNLPVASGIGGGSADAAAALRLFTRLWGTDPADAQAVAPALGSDVPACLFSMTARGTGAGDALELVDAGVSGLPVLLVNPRVALSTRDVFARWDGVDRGSLGDWRDGRNDLEAPARLLVPAIGDVLDWLGAQDGVTLARMSGSGATCFALFEREEDRDRAAADCPADWWHLASFLR